MMYKGKEPCQGCQRPGSEKQRWGKDQLCEDCKAIMKKGKAFDVYESLIHTTVRIPYNNFMEEEWDVKSPLNEHIKCILSVLDNKFAKSNGIENIGRDGGGIVNYTIPAELVEPIKNINRYLHDRSYEIRKQIAEMPKQAAAAVADEKNRIYNEGVARGRQLLIQLNNGEVTLDDFDKEIKAF